MFGNALQKQSATGSPKSPSSPVATRRSSKEPAQSNFVAIDDMLPGTVPEPASNGICDEKPRYATSASLHLTRSTTSEEIVNAELFSMGGDYLFVEEPIGPLGQLEISL